MSFWRKLNKVIFVISLVAFSLADIVVSIIFFCQGSWWWMGLIILGGGLLLIPILFSTWGILLEFMDNVAEIKNTVCTGNIKAGNAQIPQNVTNKSGNAMPGSPVSASFSSAPTVHVVSEKWACSNCGKTNDGDSAFCFNCGTRKG